MNCYMTWCRYIVDEIDTRFTLCSLVNGFKGLTKSQNKILMCEKSIHAKSKRKVFKKCHKILNANGKPLITYLKISTKYVGRIWYVSVSVLIFYVNKIAKRMKLPE